MDLFVVVQVCNVCLYLTCHFTTYKKNLYAFHALMKEFIGHPNFNKNKSFSDSRLFTEVDYSSVLVTLPYGTSRKGINAVC